EHHDDAERDPETPHESSSSRQDGRSARRSTPTGYGTSPAVNRPDESAAARMGRAGLMRFRSGGNRCPRMSQQASSFRWARFGAVERDARAGELHAGDRRIRLQNQPFQLLMLLLEHAGEVVSQDAIRSTLWASDTVVEFELGIGTAMKKLRYALGDNAATPHYIATLPRRAYR